MTARVTDGVARILGLSVASGDGIVVTPRDSAIIRHTGLAPAASPEELPGQTARRTADERARSVAAIPLRHRLVVGLKELRERTPPAKSATRSARGLSEPADRTGYKPALIVLHTTEAHELPASGLEQLSGSAETATFHVVNDWTGRDARFVADEYRAHATGPFDQVALHLAHLGVPHQSAWSAEQLRNTAQWLAYWHTLWGIPLEASTEHGVCQHSDLVLGAGDCGPRFPLAWVLHVAAGGTEATAPRALPTPPLAVPAPPAEYTRDAIADVARDQDAWLEERAPGTRMAAPPSPPVPDAPAPAGSGGRTPNSIPSGGGTMSTGNANATTSQSPLRALFPPTNRIVAFLGPYISVVSATVATWLIAHLHVGSILDVTQNQVASAISQAVIFLVTAGLTYLGQQQWMKGHHILLAQGRDGSGTPQAPAPATPAAAAPVNGDVSPSQTEAIVANLLG